MENIHGYPAKRTASKAAMNRLRDHKTSVKGYSQFYESVEYREKRREREREGVAIESCSRQGEEAEHCFGQPSRREVKEKGFTPSLGKFLNI